MPVEGDLKKHTVSDTPATKGLGAKADLALEMSASTMPSAVLHATRELALQGTFAHSLQARPILAFTTEVLLVATHARRMHIVQAGNVLTSLVMTS